MVLSSSEMATMQRQYTSWISVKICRASKESISRSQKHETVRPCAGVLIMTSLARVVLTAYTHCMHRQLLGATWKRFVGSF